MHFTPQSHPLPLPASLSPALFKSGCNKSICFTLVLLSCKTAISFYSITVVCIRCCVSGACFNKLGTIEMTLSRPFCNSMPDSLLKHT